MRKGKNKVPKLYSLDPPVAQFIIDLSEQVGTSASGVVNQHFKTMLNKYEKALKERMKEAKGNE